MVITSLAMKCFFFPITFSGNTKPGQQLASVSQQVPVISCTNSDSEWSNIYFSFLQWHKYKEFLLEGVSILWLENTKPFPQKLPFCASILCKDTFIMNSQESGIMGTCHCKNFGVRLVIKEPENLMGRRGPSSQPLHLDRSLNLYSGFY